MNKLFKVLVTVFESVLICLLLLLLLTVGFQKFSGNKDFFGYRVYTVASSSMIPDYTVGDTLLIKDVPISDINIGDAVTYLGEEKDVKDLVITHRVEKIDKDGSELLFHTKGIANNIEDPIVAEHQILGKVTYKFFILSLLCKVTYNIYLLFIFITVPLAFLIVIEIIKLSKFKDSEDEEDEEESPEEETSEEETSKEDTSDDESSEEEIEETESEEEQDEEPDEDEDKED